MANIGDAIAGAVGGLVGAGGAPPVAPGRPLPGDVVPYIEARLGSAEPRRFVLFPELRGGTQTVNAVDVDGRDPKPDAGVRLVVAAGALTRDTPSSDDPLTFVFLGFKGSPQRALPGAVTFELEQTDLDTGVTQGLTLELGPVANRMLHDLSLLVYLPLRTPPPRDVEPPQRIEASLTVARANPADLTAVEFGVIEGDTARRRAFVVPPRVGGLSLPYAETPYEIVTAPPREAASVRRLDAFEVGVADSERTSASVGPLALAAEVRPRASEAAAWSLRWEAPRQLDVEVAIESVGSAPLPRTRAEIVRLPRDGRIELDPGPQEMLRWEAGEPLQYLALELAGLRADPYESVGLEVGGLPTLLGARWETATPEATRVLLGEPDALEQPIDPIGSLAIALAPAGASARAAPQTVAADYTDAPGSESIVASARGLRRLDLALEAVGGTPRDSDVEVGLTLGPDGGALDWRSAPAGSYPSHALNPPRRRARDLRVAYHHEPAPDAPAEDTPLDLLVEAGGIPEASALAYRPAERPILTWEASGALQWLELAIAGIAADADDVYDAIEVAAGRVPTSLGVHWETADPERPRVAVGQPDALDQPIEPIGWVAIGLAPTRAGASAEQAAQTIGVRYVDVAGHEGVAASVRGLRRLELAIREQRERATLESGVYVSFDLGPDGGDVDWRGDKADSVPKRLRALDRSVSVLYVREPRAEASSERPLRVLVRAGALSDTTTLDMRPPTEVDDTAAVLLRGGADRVRVLLLDDPDPAAAELEALRSRLLLAIPRIAPEIDLDYAPDDLRLELGARTHGELALSSPREVPGTEWYRRLALRASLPASLRLVAKVLAQPTVETASASSLRLADGAIAGEDWLGAQARVRGGSLDGETRTIVAIADDRREILTRPFSAPPPAGTRIAVVEGLRLEAERGDGHGLSARVGLASAPRELAAVRSTPQVVSRTASDAPAGVSARAYGLLTLDVSGRLVPDPSLRSAVPRRLEAAVTLHERRRNRAFRARVRERAPLHAPQERDALRVRLERLPEVVELSQAGRWRTDRLQEGPALDVYLRGSRPFGAGELWSEPGQLRYDGHAEELPSAGIGFAALNILRLPRRVRLTLLPAIEGAEDRRGDLPRIWDAPPGWRRDGVRISVDGDLRIGQGRTLSWDRDEPEGRRSAWSLAQFECLVLDVLRDSDPDSSADSLPTLWVWYPELRPRDAGEFQNRTPHKVLVLETTADLRLSVDLDQAEVLTGRASPHHSQLEGPIPLRAEVQAEELTGRLAAGTAVASLGSESEIEHGLWWLRGVGQYPWWVPLGILPAGGGGSGSIGNTGSAGVLPGRRARIYTRSRPCVA